MFHMFKIVEDMFECKMLQHACLNATDMFVAKRHLIIFSRYKGRDRENINLSLFGMVSISLSKYFLHHQEGYCEVGSKRIIFLQIVFFWIKRGLENNYATTC